ncbi:hypothetical protein N2W54_006717 [Lotmaria passim]
MFSGFDASPLIPGVDPACNAMYLSLVGEMPEMYCPPGCTLHATAQGTIYVLDHVRRIGYPLQCTTSPTVMAANKDAQPVEAVAPVAAVPCPSPPVPSQSTAPVAESGAVAVGPVTSQYKRSRASSTDSRDDDDYDVDVSSWMRRGSNGLMLKTAPQFCLIPPRQRWLEDVYFALQLSSQWTRHPDLLFYCHYCRVYFAAKPVGIWSHLSQVKGHRVQRQRVRGYMASKNYLLKSSEDRMLLVASPEEIRTVPAKHFQHSDRLQSYEALCFVPACAMYRSIMNPEQRQRVVRDGAAEAAKVIQHENLLDSTPNSFVNESPQLVGWRFLMEGLDIVQCFCSKTNKRLVESTIMNHHKSQSEKK